MTQLLLPHWHAASPWSAEEWHEGPRNWKEVKFVRRQQECGARVWWYSKQHSTCMPLWQGRRVNGGCRCGGHSKAPPTAVTIYILSALWTLGCYFLHLRIQSIHVSCPVWEYFVIPMSVLAICLGVPVPQIIKSMYICQSAHQTQSYLLWHYGIILYLHSEQVVLLAADRNKQDSTTALAVCYSWFVMCWKFNKQIPLWCKKGHKNNPNNEQHHQHAMHWLHWYALLLGSLCHYPWTTLFYWKWIFKLAAENRRA